MSTYNRPWETRLPSTSLGFSNRNMNNSTLLQSNLVPGQSAINQQSNGGGSAPRPPPRNQASTQQQGYYYNSGFSPFTNYGSSPYPYSMPYGSYGGFGSYGMNFGGYNRFGGAYGGPRDIDEDTGFIQEARDGSMEAFASIESIVRAFGSVTMMLDSTFQAVYSSFNAVLSVADHFSHLKSHFGQIFSILSIIRALKWLHGKILFMFGLSRVDPSSESAWAQAEQAQSGQALVPARRRSSWPIIVFISVIYLAPFLIWRMLSSFVGGSNRDSWMTTQSSEDFIGTAVYEYEAQAKDELSFKSGNCVKFAPQNKQKDPNWPLACLGGRKGRVPVNYFVIRKRGHTASDNRPPVAANYIPTTHTTGIPASSKNLNSFSVSSARSGNLVGSSDVSEYGTSDRKSSQKEDVELGAGDHTFELPETLENGIKQIICETDTKGSSQLEECESPSRAHDTSKSSAE